MSGCRISSLNGDFSDRPTDVAQLAESLNLQRFALLGNSADSGYVAVCAALIPERLPSAVIVSGAWRMDSKEVRDNLPFLNKMFWILARHWPPGLRLMLEVMRRSSKSSRDAELEKMRRHLPAVDLAAMAQEGRLEAVQASIQECMRTGLRGAAWDLQLYVRPWDFDLGDIKIPIVLFHGEQDRNVPISLVRTMEQGYQQQRSRSFPTTATSHACPTTSMK